MSAFTWITLLLCLAACDTFAAPAMPPSEQAAPNVGVPSTLPPVPPSTLPQVPPSTLPQAQGFANCLTCTPPPVLDAGCPGTVFVFGDDRDGVDRALEEDAGLDPCKVDSDGDGCNDAAEYYLHGCDDARNAVLEPRCFAGETRTEVRYVLPVDAGPWSRVTLKLPKGSQLRVLALDAAPAGAAVVNGDEFLKVLPGATLRFQIELIYTTPGVTHGTLRVLADEQPVGSGELLILPMIECPIPV